MQEHSTTGATPLRRWRFDRVEFDERTLRLSVDGVGVEIEPKPLRLLQHLLAHAGEVIHKNALVRAVWPGRIIGDAALTKCLARVREAIGDREQALIRTHHGFGYRFVAPLEVEVLPRGIESAAQDIHAPAASLEPARDAPERRVLTVLFCDLVGSTELAESLDAETFRALLLDYQQRVGELCRRYEGQVAQQFGDGLLLQFGYPEAHDDDTERAIRCACDLLASFARPQAQAQLSLRIGIHTGAVVIGSAAPGREPLATGPGLHLAARLQTLAEPDTILISEASFRLVPGLFVTRDFGPQKLRGLAEPVRVHQVLQPSGVRSRLEAAARLTVFAGREHELALLDAGWHRALNGEGGALLLSAEPGLGKSRLLMELRARLAGQAHSWLECRADALKRHSAWQPVLDLVRRGLALKDGDDEALQLQRLEQGLDRANLDLGETLPLIAPLLGLSVPERFAAPALGPALRRQRTVTALADWVRHLAHAQPLVLVFEDLHWSDEASLAFLGALMSDLASRPILLLMTARTEFGPPWPPRMPLARCVLDPLPQADVNRMLSDLTERAPLSPALAALVHERAGGVPLFVEELARELIETAHSASGVLPDARSVPASLHGLLLARLDRLGPARELIQTAAVIGREVPHALLQAVAGLDDSTLRARLARLIEAGLLHRRGTPPETVYVFKHALIRDAAYDTLLASVRARVHGLIAATLESRFSERARAEPEVLAAHFEAAGKALDAARWHRCGAERAGEMNLAVALGHWQSIRRLLREIPKSAEAAALAAVTFHSILALVWDLGGTKDEIAAVFAEGRALAEQGGDLVMLARLGCNYAAIRGLGGSPADYVAGTTEMHRIAQQTDDPGVKLVAKCDRAWAHYWTGDLRQALLYCEEAIAASGEDPDLGREVLLFSPLASLLALRGRVLGCAGHVSRMVGALEHAAQVARQANDPSVFCWSESWLAIAGELAADAGNGEAHAERASAAAEKTGSALDRAFAAFGVAGAKTTQGRWVEAASAFDKALVAVRSGRLLIVLESFILARLSDVHLALGDSRRALEVADEAIATARRHGTLEFEIRCHIARARALSCGLGGKAIDEISRSLVEAEALVATTGAESWRPFIHEQRARLADLSGDEAARQRELCEAQRLFLAIGAPIHAERIAKERR